MRERIEQLIRAAALIACVATLGCASRAVCRVEHRSDWGTESLSLDAQGRLVRIATDDGRGGRGSTAFVYDARGRLRSTRQRFHTRGFQHPHPSSSDTTPMRRVVDTSYRYDASARPSYIRRIETRWTSRSATGRPDDRMPPIEETLRITETPGVVSMTQQRNGETTEYTYHSGEGSLVRATVISDGHSPTWRYGYDDAGRLSTVEGPYTNARLTYTTRAAPGGYMVTYEPEHGARWRFELDEAGRLASAARGVTKSYRYDEQGRLIEIIYTDRGGGDRFAYHGHCPAPVVQQLAPSPDPMHLLDEPPRPELWPEALPVHREG